MTKYEYEQGKTYLSESTPITVSRIPSGTYKISVKYGEAKGEQLFTSSPGTQKVSIMASNVPKNDWDLSNAYVVYDGDMPAYGICSVYGITGTTPVVESIAIGSGMFNSGSSTDGTFPNGTSFKCGKGLSGTTTIALHKGLGDEHIASATVPVR